MVAEQERDLFESIKKEIPYKNMYWEKVQSRLLPNPSYFWGLISKYLHDGQGHTALELLKWLRLFPCDCAMASECHCDRKNLKKFLHTISESIDIFCQILEKEAEHNTQSTYSLSPEDLI